GSYLRPNPKHTPKAEYSEHLLDGLCLLHNPFAVSPLDQETLAHERLAQAFVRYDGELDFVAPEDFLLMRSLMSVKTSENVGESST
ncbi:MAG TPA: glycosaminoglycan attachment site, partial [Methylococcaceae bacterium]|nr:glycosaminoglycan attachment site [Methylococcaceae bacterium]